jgi:hypothetical protein
VFKVALILAQLDIGNADGIEAQSARCGLDGATRCNGG